MTYTYAGGYGDNVLPTFAHVVHVYQPGTTTHATLYTDAARTTTAANPVTTDALGNLSFYVDPGPYDLYSGGTTVRVFVAADPREVGSGGGGASVLTAGGSTILVPTDGSVGLTIKFQAGSIGQGFEIFDRFNAPIFSVGSAGGPGVFGDNFRVFNGGSIFNPVVKLRQDGTIMAAQGDAAGGAGVLALGKVTTAPTSAPDGSHTMDGSTTQAGAVIWADSTGRVYTRRVNGLTDAVSGARPSGSLTTLKVGDWTTPGCNTQGTYAMSSADVNRMFLSPVDVAYTGAVYNTVGAACATAGTGATFQQFRHAIYYDDGSLARPDLSLQLVDFGFTNGYTSLKATAGTNTLSSTFSFPSVGRFWLASWFQTSGTVTTYPTLTTANMGLLASGADLSSTGGGWYVAGVTTAPPTTGTLVSTPVVPYVGLRRSA